MYRTTSKITARIAPDNIQSLKKNEVFVFGSNIEGHHGGGAAYFAFRTYGAVWGVGEGLTGHCYALQRWKARHLFAVRWHPYIEEIETTTSIPHEIRKYCK